MNNRRMRKLYHIGPTGIKIGDSIACQTFGYANSREAVAMENILELYRPDDKISRRNSAFFCDNAKSCLDAGADTDEKIYVVQMSEIAINNKSDFNWLQIIDLGFEDEWMLKEAFTDKELEDICSSYWSGKACPGKPPTWEYRSSKEQVIAVISVISTKHLDSEPYI
jgi:hypothetical protein